MTLIIDWRSSNENKPKVLRVITEVAALEIHLSGGLIQKTEWCSPQQKPCSLANSAIAAQIKKYLQNPIDTLLRVELKKQGTVFSNRIWDELCKIPFGQTITYSELANRVDSGARAVAGACRKNPFPGIIPCHRVISVSGIGGFMGQKQGEFIELKRRLLEFEALVIGQANG